MIESIRKNYEFRKLYAKGKSVVTPLFVIYYKKSNGSRIRLGITVSKKVGGAVQRNRAKRVLKESFRHIAQGLPPVDMILVARVRTAQVKSTVIERKMKEQFLREGLLQRQTSSANKQDKVSL